MQQEPSGKPTQPVPRTTAGAAMARPSPGRSPEGRGGTRNTRVSTRRARQGCKRKRGRQ
jgi:hypothetical protein